MKSGTSNSCKPVFSGTFTEFGLLLTILFLCFFLIFSNVSGCSRFFFCLILHLIPGPFLASTTWAQCFFVSFGRVLHLLTISTHALQISPHLVSSRRKHFKNAFSYFSLFVYLELGKK